MSSEALRLADLFELEQDPESLYRQAASIASLESERDQLRAEVERLRPNALRYEWLTEDHPKQETRVWVHQIAMTFNTRGRGHIDAAIDRAIEAAKEAK